MGRYCRDHSQCQHTDDGQGYQDSCHCYRDSSHCDLGRTCTWRLTTASVLTGLQALPSREDFYPEKVVCAFCLSLPRPCPLELTCRISLFPGHVGAIRVESRAMLDVLPGLRGKSRLDLVYSRSSSFWFLLVLVLVPPPHSPCK